MASASQASVVASRLRVLELATKLRNSEAIDRGVTAWTRLTPPKTLKAPYTKSPLRFPIEDSVGLARGRAEPCSAVRGALLRWTSRLQIDSIPGWPMSLEVDNDICTIYVRFREKNLAGIGCVLFYYTAVYAKRARSRALCIARARTKRRLVNSPCTVLSLASRVRSSCAASTAMDRASERPTD